VSQLSLSFGTTAGELLTFDDLPPYQPQSATVPQYVGGVADAWSGEKFLGGFGVTRNFEIVDHWLIRKRSKQIFTENLYARGLIRRLITNEINKGLALEAVPDADILGLDPETLADWSERTERRFAIYGKNPDICDYRQSRTFGALQRQARLMAMVSGDVLVLLRQGPTGLPAVDLIDAEAVSTPLSDTMLQAVKRRGNSVEHGVEIDPAGRHVAFFVQLKSGTWRRIPAKGPKTGRLQAWLYYGTERLIDDVRGQSLLALVLQSLREIDRYRDAEQRAAVINSMIAVWVEKGENKMSSLPLTGGATRRDTVTTQNDSGGRKDVQFSAHMPGMMFQEMQVGEKLQSYDTRRPNVNFGLFEAAVLSAVAWANEIPPETFFLQFQNNYSASRGATNEFRMYLNKERARQGEEFDGPIYADWLLSEILNGSNDAPGFLDAWADPNKWDIYGAWILSDWAGEIKPNVDLLKEVNAYKALVGEGFITRDRASRELTGMKFSKVVQQLMRENTQIAEALEPLIAAGLVKDENPDYTPRDESMDEEEAGNGA